MPKQIVFRTENVHYTPEEIEYLSLKEVVTREGFQNLRVTTLNPSDNSEPVKLYVAQYVVMDKVEL